MPAKQSGFKTITFKENIARRYNLTAAKLSFQLVLAAEEKDHLRNLAVKITKWPETVRVYTNPYIEKKSGV